ncbi:hypothetical protein [Arthrobacter sp. Soil762]|uniref:hypothetical protein n=1 Tax=Arthrobacter sp. Soil762 TaxID=1736401 RepID=UPI0006F1D486|nr:hypothetical protein [Arthrobacter sp. Soil762]KRE72144.1 hypothetical protein ASG77_09660 [Arthrobacter sp. Soil762]
MPAAKELSKSTFPLPLLVCVALMVAMVGGARYWEKATGVGYLLWLAGGLVPLVAGALIYRNSKRPLDFPGSRFEPAGVRRPGFGGLLTALVLFVVPRLVGDGAAELALNNGADAFAAAVTATAVPFAVVVLGYRAAETALNRRDAAIAAGQP